ncbi:MAG: futalosine hydrolase [Fibrobacteres bacterium]|nr:futalosine hydrolase [Fibrobacterota bacterium]
MILLCAATRMEMDACLGPLGEAFASLPSGPRPWTRRRGRVLLAVTGPGIPLTLARLMPLVLSERPSALVDIGIAGAYAGSGLSIGDLVMGENERFGDLGMETPEPQAFLPMSGFDWSDPIYASPLALSLDPLGPLDPSGKAAAPKRARGCTVNACTGTAATGARRRATTGADFESMEGAAAALAGLEAGIPVAELRAISNAAADRDMRPENIGLALRALGSFVSAWLERSA